MRIDVKRPMLAIVASLLAVAVHAADKPTLQPWSDPFPVIVGGQERQFGYIDGEPWLVAQKADLLAPPAASTDVVVLLKVRLRGEVRGFHALDAVQVEVPPSAWLGRIDGDNVWALARLEAGAKPQLRVRRLLAAPTDADRLAARLQGVAATDVDARLAVAAWARANALSEGGKEYWAGAADSIVSGLVDAVGAAASQAKDLVALLRAMDLAIDQLKDPGRAALLASETWVPAVAGPDADAIALRLRRLGFDRYAGVWSPRADALRREFEDRFADIPWRDAEAFYRLGRWADEKAEELPQSRDRSWRCYQAGFKANPSHPGIRRELGLDPVAVGAGDAVASQFDLHDAGSGVRVPAPAGWRRGEAGDQDAEWVDASSDTARISARLAVPAGDFAQQWAAIVAEWSTREAYAVVAEEEVPVANAMARRQRFTYHDGTAVRHVALALWRQEGAGRSVRLTARGDDGEDAKLDQALAEQLAAISVVSMAPAPQPAP